MHVDGIAPEALLKHGYAIKAMGARRVTLSRPLLLQVQGVNEPEAGWKAQLFVLGSTLGELYHLGEAPASALGPLASASQVLAARFPGLSVREPDGRGGYRVLTEVFDQTTLNPPPANPAPAAAELLGGPVPEDGPEDVSGWVDPAAAGGVVVDLLIAGDRPKPAEDDGGDF